MLSLIVAGLLAQAPSGESVVVFPQLEPSLPEPVRQEVVRVAGDVLLQNELVATPPGTGCTSFADPACLQTLLEGRLGLTVAVELKASDYAVTARVIAADGSVVETSEAMCKICRHDELPGTVKKVVQDVVASFEDANPMGTLAIVSTPSGATVLVDGAQAGTTPLELEVPVGRHDIEVRAPGRVAITDQADLPSGEVTRRAYELAADSPVSPRTEVGLGWGAVAVGAVLAFSGVALLIVDEREIASKCGGNDVDADGDCRFLYDTVATGAGLLAGGVVAGAGGGLLVWHGKRRSARAATRVTMNPMGLRVTF